MIRALFWIGLGLFIVWLAKATGLAAAALIFLLAGVIPGTSFSVPPVVMLILLGIALFGVLQWVRRQQLAAQIRELKAQHDKNQTQPKKKANSKKPTARKSRAKTSAA